MPAVSKAETVRRVFDSVAERYDVMNDLMSLGLHRRWKSFTISVARPRAGERVLDIATGSGDLAGALAARVLPGGEVWITDINRRMLERGRDRLLDRGLALPAAQCDAERLPFPAGYFDCVTVGFGLRNMTRKEAALAEMARVLKPGGRLVVLEFSKVWKAARAGLRLVFVQGAALARRQGGGRRRRLPLPCRVDSSASGPGDIGGDAARRRPWRCRGL